MANVAQEPVTPGGPGQSIFPITPDDAGAIYARAILCSVDMTLKVTDLAGSDVANVPFQKGWNPIGLQRVWSTGSTTGGGVIFGVR